MNPEDDGVPSPFGPLQKELARMRNANLNAAIDDVDKIIALLESTREQVAEGKKSSINLVRCGYTNEITSEADSHKISMAMTRLQNPVKERFDAITEDLKEVTKAQRGFGKALDKVRISSLQETALLERAVY